MYVYECIYVIKYQQYCYGFTPVESENRDIAPKLLAEGQFHVYP